MTEFARLPDLLSVNEKRIASGKFAEALKLAQESDDVEALGVAALEAAKWGNLVIEGYEALLARVRLADLALYRAGLLADDMEAEIANGKKRRSGPPSPEGIANMARRYVRDYIEPILGPLREALGYEEGDAQRGWYLAPEEARAKLIGSVRAEERLAREGRTP